MKYCDCDDWKKQSYKIKINDPRVKFCPWCGTKLIIKDDK